MLGLVLSFLAISSLSVFGATLKMKYEEMLPFTVFSIPVILYLFYIFNILNIGFIILLLGIIILYGLFIYRFIKSKDKKSILKNIFSKGFIVFLICYVALYFITLGNKVLLWDELRLWGAYPKILFYDGSIQLGKNSLLLWSMQSYEPGMPLFQYFILKCFARYDDAILFFAYAILGIIPILSVAKDKALKKWWHIPMCCLIMLGLPYILNNSGIYNTALTYYYTLYIDPMLGIYFAYTLYLTIKKDKEKKDYLLFILSIMVLVLLKDTGLVFAGTSILSFILNEVIVEKKYKQFEKKKSFVLYLLVPLFCALAIFGSWKVAQKIYDCENLYVVQAKDDSLNTKDYKMGIVKTFFNEAALLPIFDSNIEWVGKHLTFVGVMIILVACFIILSLIHKKDERKHLIIPIGCYFAGSLVFFFGLLGLYLFSLHTVESFVRYVSTIISAGFMLIAFIVLNKFDNRKVLYMGAGILVLLFLILPIKKPFILAETNFLTNYNDSLQYSSKIAANVDSSKEDYCLVFNEEAKNDFSYVIYDHHIYMSLIEEGFKYPYAKIFMADDVDETKKKIKACDYTYFINISDDASEYQTFSEIVDFEIDDDTLVRNKNNKFIPVK